ncbi:MAG: amino acid transporter [Acidobacteriota bacterium]|nr:amino acid transporter [Acidobacteriota bacterium]
MSAFQDWLLSDLKLPPGVMQEPGHTHPWWQVMCLTGVDYFSTLGYQPGIAFLAAGALSPIATFILVLVTLFAALPVYNRVAAESPNGQGSIAMLERLFPRWSGKLFVLILLGFAATDFVITMTLSAADGAAHLIQNPLMPAWIHHQMAVTLILLGILSAIFLKGFKEAIGVAVVLVAAYLVLNVVVVGAGLLDVLRHPQVVANWKTQLFHAHGNPLAMIGVSLLLFPRLALGLSGFETGVAVMPLVAGAGIEGRIRNTRRLLLTAALIMSVFLMASSFVTSFLIEPAKFQAGGEANGRALAYLAHRDLGAAFGSAYDISTILILAFAGASAMAGLLNLVPRYLPRYGMAPEWSRASRPLVLVFMGISFVVTFLFRADVDAQGGAYATGVLVLMTSAAIAVTILVWRNWQRWPFLLIAVVFVYTTVQNVRERPEGIKIASFFIASIILLSLVSRAMRSTELRICEVKFDDRARALLAEDNDRVFRLIARRPGLDSKEAYDRKDATTRLAHNLGAEEKLYFLEIDRGDASDFDVSLDVTGHHLYGYPVLRAISPAVPNAFAAILIQLGKDSGELPHVYFAWGEGNPVAKLFRFIFLGEGDAAPITHEVLRKAVPNIENRPLVHVT